MAVTENPESGDMYEPVMVFAECFCHEVPQKIDKPFVKKVVNMMD